jgi:hypothetical protein
MTRWLWLIAVPGGSVILAAVLVRWLLQRHSETLAARDAGRIKPFIYQPGMEKHDDSLRLRTERRRGHAEDMRREAARIESGAESEARRKLRSA